METKNFLKKIIYSKKIDFLFSYTSIENRRQQRKNLRKIFLREALLPLKEKIFGESFTMDSFENLLTKIINYKSFGRIVTIDLQLIGMCNSPYSNIYINKEPFGPYVVQLRDPHKGVQQFTIKNGKLI